MKLDRLHLILITILLIGVFLFVMFTRQVSIDDSGYRKSIKDQREMITLIGAKLDSSIAVNKAIMDSIKVLKKQTIQINKKFNDKRASVVLLSTNELDSIFRSSVLDRR